MDGQAAPSALTRSPELPDVLCQPPPFWPLPPDEPLPFPGSVPVRALAVLAGINRCAIALVVIAIRLAGIIRRAGAIGRALPVRAGIVGRSRTLRTRFIGRSIPVRAGVVGRAVVLHPDNHLDHLPDLLLRLERDDFFFTPQDPGQETSVGFKPFAQLDRLGFSVGFPLRAELGPQPFQVLQAVLKTLRGDRQVIKTACFDQTFDFRKSGVRILHIETEVARIIRKPQAGDLDRHLDRIQPIAWQRIGGRISDPAAPGE